VGVSGQRFIDQRPDHRAPGRDASVVGDASLLAASPPPVDFASHGTYVRVRRGAPTYGTRWLAWRHPPSPTAILSQFQRPSSSLVHLLQLHARGLAGEPNQRLFRNANAVRMSPSMTKALISAVGHIRLPRAESPARCRAPRWRIQPPGRQRSEDNLQRQSRALRQAAQWGCESRFGFEPNLVDPRLFNSLRTLYLRGRCFSPAASIAQLGKPNFAGKTGR
jgi:hypothetical protein